MLVGFAIEDVEDLIRTNAPKWLVSAFFDSESDSSMTIVNSTPYDLKCFHLIDNANNDHNIIDFLNCFPDYIPVGCSVICPIKEHVRAKVGADGGFRYFQVGYEILDDGDCPQMWISYFNDDYFKAFMLFDTLQYYRLSQATEIDIDWTLTNTRPIIEQAKEFELCSIVKTEVISGYSDNLLVIGGTKGIYQIYSESQFVSITSFNNPDFSLQIVLFGLQGRSSLIGVRQKLSKSESNWYFIDGYIKNELQMEHDYVLEIVDGNPNEGAQLTFGARTGGLHQQWSFGSLGVNGGTIVSKLNNMVIDIADNNFVDGAKVIMWPANGGDNQRWTIHA